MDPISLSSIIVGLAAKFLSVANRCHALYEKDKLAFVTIHALNHKARSVNTFLDGINHLLLDPRSAPVVQSLALPRWHESLMAATDACRLTYECLEAELAKLGLDPVAATSKKGISIWQRMRLHWNEDGLKAAVALLDTTIDSVRCLLDVLTTAMLVPVVQHASCNLVARQASVLQRKLLQADERINARFSMIIPNPNSIRAPSSEYPDEITSEVYPRYRDNLECIRSIYSSEESEFGVLAMSSTDSFPEPKMSFDDGYSFVSTTPLIPPDESEKSPSCYVDRVDNNEAAGGGLCSEKPQRIEGDGTGSCCSGDSGGAETETTSLTHETPTNGDHQDTDDERKIQAVLEPILIADLYGDLGIKISPDVEDGWVETESPTLGPRVSFGETQSHNTLSKEGEVSGHVSLLSGVSAASPDSDDDDEELVSSMKLSALHISVAGDSG